MPYTVQFDSGHSVEFDGPPSASDIDEVSKQFAAPQAAPDNSAFSQGPDQSDEETSRLDRQKGKQGFWSKMAKGSPLDEATSSIASGMGAGMLGGIGYVGGAIGHLFNKNIDPSDVMQSVQDAYTTQPTSAKGKEYVANFNDAMKSAAHGTGQVLKAIGESSSANTLDQQMGIGGVTNPVARMLGKPNESDAPDELFDSMGEAALNVAPIHLPFKGARMLLDGAVGPKISGKLGDIPMPKGPEAPVAPVDPNMALYQAHAEALAQAARDKPIYVDPQGGASHDAPFLQPDRDTALPQLPMDDVAPSATPPSLEPAVEPPRPLPELPDPAATHELPDTTPQTPDLRILDHDEPTVQPNAETPLPTLPDPERGLLDLQDKAPEVPNANTPLPTLEFPDRITAFNSDPWLQKAGDRVQELAGQVTPEARAETQALTEHAVELAKNQYGIDADTARQKLYESGGPTQGPIQKTFSQRGLGGARQSGSFDLSGLASIVPQSLIDRFKKKGPADPGVTPEAKAIQDVVPNAFKPSILDKIKAITDPKEVYANVMNGEKDISKLGAKTTSLNGVNNHAMKTGNSVLRFVDTKIYREGIMPAKGMIAKFLTDPKTGVATLLNKMDHTERMQAFQAVLKEDQANLRYSDSELKGFGFSDKTINLLKSLRENNTNIFALNGRGDFRPGYFNHSFRGAYTAVAVDAQGNIRGVINVKNAFELKQAKDYVAKNHADLTTTEVSRRQIRSADSYNKGVITVSDLNDIMKKNGGITNEAVNNLVNDRNLTSTRNLFDGNKHDYNRSKQDVWGWDGNKPWLSPEQNMREGWKSYIATSEQQYFHHMLQDPVNQIKELLSNQDIMDRQENAVEAAHQYMKQKIGQTDPWWSGQVVNSLADQIAKYSGGFVTPQLINASHTLTRWMQLGTNVANFAAQMLQPALQGIPNMLFARKALAMNPLDMAKATQTGVTRFIMDKMGQATDPFTQRMWKYADDNGIRSYGAAESAMDATKNRGVSVADKILSFLPSFAENNTRPPMFSVFASMAKAAWDKDPTIFKDETDLFHTASKLTDTVMVNYDQNPAVYRKMFGVAGPLVGQFKTFGFAATQNLVMLAKNDPLAFAAAIGSLTYFTGLSGLPFYQDVNNIIKNVSPHISDKIMDIQDYTHKMFPELSKLTGISEDALFKGGASQDLGFNVQPRFSFSNTVPAIDSNSDKPGWQQVAENAVPAESSIVKPAIAVGKAAGSGFQNKGLNEDAVKQALPQLPRSIFTNKVLTDANGNVTNPATGMFDAHTRTPHERDLANFGLVSNQEVTDKDTKFKGDQQVHFMVQARSQIEQQLIQKMGTDSLKDGDVDKAANDYTQKFGGDPKAFANTLVTKLIAAHEEGVTRGAGIPTNSIASINRYLQYHPEIQPGK